MLVYIQSPGFGCAHSIRVLDHDVIQISQSHHEVFTCCWGTILTSPLVLGEGNLEAEWLARRCSYPAAVLKHDIVAL